MSSFVVSLLLRLDLVQTSGQQIIIPITLNSVVGQSMKGLAHISDDPNFA